MAATTIRDLREKKNLSQDKVAAAAGLTYSKFVRVEEGTGKTTAEEVKAVLDVLKDMEPGTRKLAGRPFKDPAKQAAVVAARESGSSVADVLGVVTPKAPAKKTAGATDMAKALAKKTPARSRTRKPKADAGTSSVSSLLP